MAETSLPALCSIDDFLKHEYDFIVIGGGTAGLCVAARLTEVPNVQVGVLEAGPAHLNDPMIMIPALYPKAIGDSKYDWKHMTVPQVCRIIPLTHCLGDTDRKFTERRQ
jgi:choline dehydrogenase-like flavoprotein